MNYPAPTFVKSIRFKIFSVMLVCFIGFLVVISLISITTIKSKFQDIENQKVGDNLNRITDAYKSDIEDINVKASDWSNWDDTYKFVSDKNEDYAKSNLELGSIQNLGINFMIFVNKDSQIVAASGIDRIKGTVLPVPKDLDSLVATGSSILQTDATGTGKTGILSLKTGFLMFASRPILKSNRSGPANGTLIFGTYVDEIEKAKLSNLTHLKIEILPIDSTNRALKDGKNVISVHDGESIYGFTQVNNFFGKPAFIFKIDYPRDITKGGLTTIYYFLGYFAASGLALMVIIVFHLNIVLIHKITKLVKEVGGGGDITLYKDGDEISVLAESIDHAFKKVEDAESRFKIFMNNIPNLTWIKDGNTWQYFYINESFQKFFKMKKDEIYGKTDFNIWPKDVAENLRKNDEEVMLQKNGIQAYENIPDFDGVTHTWLVYKFPLTIGGNNYVGGVATDITSIKNTQDELEKMNSLMVGRELKMVELKKEIEDLKNIKNG